MWTLILRLSNFPWVCFEFSAYFLNQSRPVILSFQADFGCWASGSHFLAWVRLQYYMLLQVFFIAAQNRFSSLSKHQVSSCSKTSLCLRFLSYVPFLLTILKRLHLAFFIFHLSLSLSMIFRDWELISLNLLFWSGFGLSLLTQVDPKVSHLGLWRTKRLYLLTTQLLIGLVSCFNSFWISQALALSWSKLAI